MVCSASKYPPLALKYIEARGQNLQQVCFGELTLPKFGRDAAVDYLPLLMISIQHRSKNSCVKY